MLCYNRIDVSEDNDVNKTSASIVYRKILLGNWKLLMIYFIIDRILHYPKKTVHRLFTNTTIILQIYMEMFCERPFLKHWTKYLKISKKTFFFQ